MKLHELKPVEGARKDSFRLGRGQGSGNGKTAGKGHEGVRLARRRVCGQMRKRERRRVVCRRRSGGVVGHRIEHVGAASTYEHCSASCGESARYRREQTHRPCGRGLAHVRHP